MLLSDKFNSTNEIFAVTLVGGDGHRYFTRGCAHMRSPVLLHFGKRVAYPNQSTLAALRGVSQQAISLQLKQLREAGAVIDLEPVGQKHPDAFQRGSRYFVPIRLGDQPPPLEVIRSDILAPVRRPPNE